MRESILRWVDVQKNVYFDNGATKRDMRVQLRGSKAIVLWLAYLAILVFPAVMIYSGVAAESDLPLSIVQSRLHGCYQAVLMALGAVVSLIAPALGATAIVSERQRHRAVARIKEVREEIRTIIYPQ